MPSLIFPSSFSSSKAASSWLVSSFCLIPAAQTMPQYIWMAIMAWHLHWMSTFQSGSTFFCWHAQPAVSPRVNHSAMSSVWKVTIILMHLVQVVWKQRSPTPSHLVQFPSTPPAAKGHRIFRSQRHFLAALLSHLDFFLGDLCHSVVWQNLDTWWAKHLWRHQYWDHLQRQIQISYPLNYMNSPAWNLK